jgi:hypothetical protein
MVEKIVIKRAISDIESILRSCSRLHTRSSLFIYYIHVPQSRLFIFLYGSVLKKTLSCGCSHLEFQIEK